MANVRVVTDSTADLSVDLLESYGLEMVPLNVHFGDAVFKDVIEMDNAHFWRQLQGGAHHPRTSQPAPGEFLEVYRRLGGAGQPVVSLHISAQLSGTIGSAQVAQGMLDGIRVELVDTRSVSMGLGMLAILAARMAASGAGAKDIAQWIEATAARQYIYFGVGTLEFLAKGGRIGKAQALLGGLLNVKPILSVEDGLVTSADKVRGKSKVLPRILDLLEEKIPPGRRVNVAMIHAQAAPEAAVWLDAVRGRYQVAESWIRPLGAVVAAHAGPGTVGIVMHEVM